MAIETLYASQPRQVSFVDMIGKCCTGDSLKGLRSVYRTGSASSRLNKAPALMAREEAEKYLNLQSHGELFPRFSSLTKP